MTALVLRSNDTCFLGALRGFAGAGLDVHSAIFDYPGAPLWLSRHSRHCEKLVRLLNPAEAPDEAVAALEEAGRKLCDGTGEKTFAVPSSDTGLMLFAQHWERLYPYYVMMGAADWSGPRADCIDKGLCADLLARSGVPQPVTTSVSSSGDIPAALDKVPLPAVYKPAVKDYAQSFYRAHGGAKAVSCTGKDELRAGLEVAVAAGHRLVVQERLTFASAVDEIPIYVYADERHQVRMAVSAIKQVIHPAPFGTASVLRLNWQAELLPLARKVVEALRWRGPLMIEFIKDERDGQWKLIEVNGRPWLLIDFFRQAGFDFLAMLQDDRAGRLPAGDSCLVPPWPAREAPVQVDALREAAGRKALAGAVFAPARLEEEWARLPGPVSFTYDDVDDPGPGLAMRRRMSAEYGITVPISRYPAAPLALAV